MEEVEGRHEQPRIKLFGKMIGVQGIKEEQKGEDEEDLGVQADDEKIIPCPRCKSMDTKFCYFNNYNVNQPRHFCKGCQRYWTAGGALRNVPVGAGRRKAKPPCQESCTFENPSQVQFDHHLIISGALGHREDMVLQPSDSEGQLY